MSETRSQKLTVMLEKAGGRDAFLLYALAMEHKKLNELGTAIELLTRCVDVDPGYCYAYYQLGQIHEAAGDEPAARAAYEAGLLNAKRVGDQKALGEIGQALDLL